MSTSRSNQHNKIERGANFVVAITDPENPDFGNIEKNAETQLRVSKNTSIKGCFKQRKDLRSEIERILEERGMGQHHRSDFLASIVLKRGTRVTKRYNKEGQLVERIESEPSFADQIKAIEVMNRMAGTYDDNKVKRDLAKAEYKSLLSKLMKDDEKERAGKVVEAEVSVLEDD
jgi:hypothetical protein